MAPKDVIYCIAIMHDVLLLSSIIIPARHIMDYLR
jgi:hypothetical protein